jgi:hypothetical protein
MNLLSQLTAANRSSPNKSAQIITQETRLKQRATIRRKMVARWRKVFAELGWRAGTATLALNMGYSHAGAYHSLRILFESGVITKDGIIPHPHNGRDQIIWLWVGDKHD